MWNHARSIQMHESDCRDPSANACAHRLDGVLPAHVSCWSELGQPGWVAALTALSVGLIVADSTTRLAESRSHGPGGLMPWALLVVGSAGSLAANVAVAEPTATGRVSAAWPTFALISSCERQMRQARRAAGAAVSMQKSHRSAATGATPRAGGRVSTSGAATIRGKAVGTDVRLAAWRWAPANRADDGSRLSGREKSGASMAAMSTGGGRSSDPGWPGFRRVRHDHVPSSRCANSAA